MSRREQRPRGKTIHAWQADLGRPDLPMNRRRRAVRALGRAARVDCRTVLPTLLGALADERLASDVRHELNRLSPTDSVQRALLEALAAAEPGVRAGAAQVLGSLGRELSGAVPALTRALQDPVAEVRRQAAAALGRIGWTAGPAVPALVEALHDPAAEVRAAAAAALPETGRHARAVHPSLLAALGDPAPSVVRVAVEAVARLTREHPDLLPVLSETLRTAELPVRRGTVAVLGRLGQAAAPALPALAATLQEDDLAAGVVQALSWLGPEGVPLVLSALRHPRPEARQQALFSLLTSPAAAALPPGARGSAAAALVSDPDLNVRRLALSVLGVDPEAAGNALPGLASALRDDDLHVRNGAVVLLLRHAGTWPAAAALLHAAHAEGLLPPGLALPPLPG
jgi:HEAT repeat protein